MTAPPPPSWPDPALRPDATRTHYDPVRHLRRSWPHVRLVVEELPDDLLGEVRDGGTVIAVRAGTSSAQRRCTIAHEIVHLERGLHDCGPWWYREELAVHSTAARRLISLPELIAGVRELGGAEDRAALAHVLDVDSETLLLRLTRLHRADRAAVRRALSRTAPLWSSA